MNENYGCLIWLILILIICIFCFKACNHESYVEPNTKIAKYLTQEFNNGVSEVVLEIKDLVVNHPKNPTPLTAIVVVENTTQIIEIKARSNSPYSPKDAYYYTNYNELFKYIDSSEYDFKKYIVIKNSGQYKVRDLCVSIYSKIYCELYINDVSFGENSNGKFPNIDTMEID